MTMPDVTEPTEDEAVDPVEAAFLNSPFGNRLEADADEAADDVDETPDDSALDGEDLDDVEGSDGSDEEEPATDSSEPAPTYRIGELELSADEAEALAGFYTWAQGNPDQVRVLDAYLSGQAAVLPVEEYQRWLASQEGASGEAGSGSGTASASPDDNEDDDIDWDSLDPAIAARLRRIDELEARVQSVDEASQNQRIAMARSALGRAADNFQKRYDLSDEDMVAITDRTARMGIVPQLAESAEDTIGALEEAFDAAYWATPEYRQREIDRQVSQASSDKSRRRKAAALSGSSGSVPRTTPEPKTSDERRAAMVSEITAAMQDGSIPT